MKVSFTVPPAARKRHSVPRVRKKSGEAHSTSASAGRMSVELKERLEQLVVDSTWIPGPQWAEFMRETACHLHLVFPQQSGFLLAMGLLSSLSPYPVNRLARHQLHLYVENLWSHLQAGVPWTWPVLFEEVLFEKREMSASEFLERLLEAARSDPRNPGRKRENLAWRHAVFTHRGNTKQSLEDLVLIRRVGEVHLCLVADGVSRSTVGSGADAVRVAARVFEENAERIDAALRDLDAEKPLDVWAPRARFVLMDAASMINQALIEAIRGRHEGTLLPSHEIMSLACTMALIRKDACVLAQCGDCAAFLFEEGRLIPLTREHTVRYENLLAFLEGRPRLPGPPAAVTHLLPPAVNTAGVQVLVPTLGDLVTFSFVRLSSGSRLLVTTDGILPKNIRRRGYLAEELRGLPADLPVEEQVQRLARRALQELGEDNLGFALWIPETKCS